MGDALSPALAIDVRFGSLGDCSGMSGGAVLRKTWVSASEADTMLGRCDGDAIDEGVVGSALGAVGALAVLVVGP